MAREYLDSITLPVVGIDIVLGNIADKPHDQWAPQFIQTQIGILDRTTQQLISTGPATCDTLTDHHARLIDLVIALDGALQAQLNGNSMASEIMLEKVMSAIVDAGESLQKVIALAEATPPPGTANLPPTAILRSGPDLRATLIQRDSVKCVDEVPGQYRCNFPLEGTTGDVMIVSTSAGTSTDFTALYLDFDKEVQFGEVDRFYALMVQHTISDASTASRFSSWLADGLVSSLCDWDSTATEVVAFETEITQVHFKVTATTSVLTYKACIGEPTFCFPDE